MSVTPRLEPTQAKASNFAAASLALGEIPPVPKKDQHRHDSKIHLLQAVIYGVSNGSRKGPARSGAFLLLALSECKRRSRNCKSSPGGQHICRRFLFRGRAVCSSTGGGHECQSVEDICCHRGALRQGGSIS
jgi:hypothetical protein